MNIHPYRNTKLMQIGKAGHSPRISPCGHQQGYQQPYKNRKYGENTQQLNKSESPHFFRGRETFTATNTSGSVHR